MRLFLAIDFPEETKKEIYDVITPIRLQYRRYKWVPQENYHITLHFFGDVPKETVPALVSRLEQCLFECKEFSLTLLSGGVFIRSNIVLYLDFYREKMIDVIVKKIREDLEHDGNKYVPHITIARSRIPSKQQYLLIKKKLESVKPKMELPVTSVVLFESIKRRSYTEYREVARFPLLAK